MAMSLCPWWSDNNDGVADTHHSGKLKPIWRQQQRTSAQSRLPWAAKRCATISADAPMWRVVDNTIVVVLRRAFRALVSTWSAVSGQ